MLKTENIFSRLLKITKSQHGGGTTGTVRITKAVTTLSTCSYSPQCESVKTVLFSLQKQSVAVISPLRCLIKITELTLCRPSAVSTAPEIPERRHVWYDSQPGCQAQKTWKISDFSLMFFLCCIQRGSMVCWDLIKCHLHEQRRGKCQMCNDVSIIHHQSDAAVHFLTLQRASDYHLDSFRRQTCLWFTFLKLCR